MIKYDNGVELSGSGEQIVTEWIELSARIAEQISKATDIEMSFASESMSRLFIKAVESFEEKKC